jgi:hypothetical protein
MHHRDGVVKRGCSAGTQREQRQRLASGPTQRPRRAVAEVANERLRAGTEPSDDPGASSDGPDHIGDSSKSKEAYSSCAAGHDREEAEDSAARRSRAAEQLPKSQYRGVCWYKPGGKWKAQVQWSAGYCVFAGYHSSEEEAAQAYNNKIRQLVAEGKMPEAAAAKLRYLVEGDQHQQATGAAAAAASAALVPAAAERAATAAPAAAAAPANQPGAALAPPRMQPAQADGAAKRGRSAVASTQREQQDVRKRQRTSGAGAAAASQPAAAATPHNNASHATQFSAPCRSTPLTHGPPE